jgi:hypothetical protein
MTGGQISPTSPKGSFGTTAPYGNQMLINAELLQLQVHHILQDGQLFKLKT